MPVQHLPLTAAKAASAASFPSAEILPGHDGSILKTEEVKSKYPANTAVFNRAVWATRPFADRYTYLLASVQHRIVQLGSNAPQATRARRHPREADYPCRAESCPDPTGTRLVGRVHARLLGGPTRSKQYHRRRAQKTPWPPNSRERQEPFFRFQHFLTVVFRPALGS